MKLSSRISHLETKHTDKPGRWHTLTANSSAEAASREAEMRARGLIAPDDDVLRIIVINPGDPEGPMVRRIND